MNGSSDVQSNAGAGQPSNPRAAVRRILAKLTAAMFAIGLLTRSSYTDYCLSVASCAPDLAPASHRRDLPHRRRHCRQFQFPQQLLVVICSLFSTSDINGSLFGHPHLRNRRVLDGSSNGVQRCVHLKQQLGDIGRRHVSPYHDGLRYQLWPRPADAPLRCSRAVLDAMV